jgi:hypothetical protein
MVDWGAHAAESVKVFCAARIRAMRLQFVKVSFHNPDYIFELKHDGVFAEP